MTKKRILSYLSQKGASIVASCVMAVAVLSINSACALPFYEPEQPNELEHLKKNHK